jgi:hypothetical protein
VKNEDHGLKLKAKGIIVPVTGHWSPVTGCLSVESFSDIVEIFHAEIVQGEVFAFEFLYVKTVESRVFQEIFAQQTVLIRDYGRQDVMDVDRFLLDGENDLMEEFIRYLMLDLFFIAQVVGDLPPEELLVGLGGIFRIEVSDPFPDNPQNEEKQPLLFVYGPELFQQVDHRQAFFFD